MAIVVNPTVTQRPDAMNQLALQIIAQKQATNKANERADLDTQFQTLKAEIEAMDKSGKLQNMLHSGNPDEVNAARQKVAQFMDVFARRSGRRVSPELLQAETDAFLMKYSEGALTMEEKGRLSYPGPSESSAPPAPSPAASGASSPTSPSGGAPATSGAATQTTSAPAFKIRELPIDDPATGKNYGANFILEDASGKEILRGSSKDDLDVQVLEFNEAAKSGNWDALAQKYNRAEWGVNPQKAIQTLQERHKSLQSSGYQPGPYEPGAWEPKTGEVQTQPQTQAEPQDTPDGFRKFVKTNPAYNGKYSGIKDTGRDLRSDPGNERLYQDYLNFLKGTAPEKRPISSTPEIAAEAKRQADSFQAGGDEMSRRANTTPEISAKAKELAPQDEMGPEFFNKKFLKNIPKVAQAQAKSVQEGKAEYDEIQEKKARGIKIELKDIFKSRKIEKESFAVMYAKQSTPEFKQITKETKAETRKFIKEADPAEIAAAGLATVAEIKNDQERNKINELIALSQVKVAGLQKEAAAGQAYAQVLMESYKQAFGVISTAVSTGKTFKGVQDLRQDPALNDAFNTVAKLMGASVEDIIQLQKTGFFKKKLTAVPDDNFADPLQVLRGALDLGTTSSGKADWQTYAQLQMGNKP